MEKKYVLITGASSGFGLLTTIELAKRGFSVIATMRNEEKKEKVIELCKQFQVEKQITCLQLDVTCKKSLQHLSEHLNQFPKIDILINNAGFAFGGFCEEVSLQEYKEQFETNFFGVIAVTQAVLPFMRKQKQGKIINLSSISGKIGFPGLSPYVASKHALEGWSECLRLEVKPFGIDVALIEPGSFATNIWSSGKRIAKKANNTNSPYDLYMKAIEDQLEKGKEEMGDPKEVASLIANICEQDRLKALRYPIGKGVKLAFYLKKWFPWTKWEQLFYKKLLHKKV
ncbi:SDR family oxidoreductase [Bacillus aquiflavi]|uniref:SDR family oxidoreductase n=1 Tax=Bacillus aquiflavi TaxID=2672567 RepID=A0A6B3VSI9_9BACI|nr:oxidoreductase [Bacillus aquiflavi]MBA4536572.1 SDR family oxidoreductase [Bacillus aquiflavi]NEY80939.1 SDR family oxidoreductase [Bacillus aquiflavi]UAC49654.1 oxidoreductase [Bacillus aquiflavi]